MSDVDHMNAHLHADGTIGYWHPCDEYCKEEAQEVLRKVKHSTTPSSAGGVMKIYTSPPLTFTVKADQQLDTSCRLYVFLINGELATVQARNKRQAKKALRTILKRSKTTEAHDGV